jgi:hypothetical protein
LPFSTSLCYPPSPCSGISFSSLLNLKNSDKTVSGTAKDGLSSAERLSAQIAVQGKDFRADYKSLARVWLLGSWKRCVAKVSGMFLVVLMLQVTRRLSMKGREQPCSHHPAYGMIPLNLGILPLPDGAW